MIVKIEELVRLTIRARVVFTLAIAEMLLPDLREEPAYPLAVDAYDAAVRWQQQLDVSPDTLLDFLANERDEGITVYADIHDPRNEVVAWTTLGNALSYLLWHAYRLAGHQYFPEGIEDVTEKYVQILIDEASNARSYDDRYVQRVYEYLQSKYRIRDGDELGEPIDIAEVKHAALPR